MSDASSEQPGDDPLLVADVLLLLFQPSSGTIAGENFLFYVLGGAVVTDLTLRNLAAAQEAGRFVHRVEARGEAPDDDILRSAWDYLATRPRDAQTVIAAIGPELRSKVLDRLVDDGHLRRERTKMFGFIPTESLELASVRRTELLARVRATLVDGVAPDPRTAAITALLSASANLHRFDPDIPWTSSVIHRAKEFENGSWGAAAAGEAVTVATIAVISAALIASTAGSGAG
ncbi:GPP34 family phosphoprotein [Actinoplanes sp. M2I2]|uniref:GOLPH3/VPS74 family protein n=1 Tax=Actinoplanes sp. M2I2 TaxID=1734444 RepID=UPI0024C2CE4D|nr:GPP34 family phosphoprotein [Actinoplanes sp. M2I2]